MISVDSMEAINFSKLKPFWIEAFSLNVAAIWISRELNPQLKRINQSIDAFWNVIADFWTSQSEKIGMLHKSDASVIGWNLVSIKCDGICVSFFPRSNTRLCVNNPLRFRVVCVSVTRESHAYYTFGINFIDFFILPLNWRFLAPTKLSIEYPMAYISSEVSPLTRLSSSNFFFIHFFSHTSHLVFHFMLCIK